jgi:hypothetical protein
MARYACDLAAGESANAAASALSEKLVDPGRDAGVVVGTHSAADDAVVAKCRPHGEAMFACRGNVNVLVVVVHREMRPRGHSCLRDRPRSVGHRPNAKLGGLPGRRIITQLKALTRSTTSSYTNSVSVWYNLHWPDTNELVIVGSKVVSLDRLCPAFNACSNPDIFQHHFWNQILPRGPFLHLSHFPL